MSTSSPDQNDDLGARLLRGLVMKLLVIVEDPEAKLSSSEGELIRKLCTDNSVTLASIQRGDFGVTAQRAAAEFPFDENGQQVLQ